MYEREDAIRCKYVPSGMNRIIGVVVSWTRKCETCQGGAQVDEGQDVPSRKWRAVQNEVKHAR